MRRTPGFSLVEILIVVGIMTVLMGLVLGAIRGVLISAGQQTAKAQMQTIAMAAAWYVRDWEQGPEFNPTATPRESAALLFDALCKIHKKGEGTVGGHMPTNETNTHQAPGLQPALISPLKGFYSFGYEGNASFDRVTHWVIVDPGSDKLLGGTLSGEKGFQSDNSDANGDGKADHLDNLLERISLR